jgi:catechol 2,3-dioxygenase-like lactoylglutathione lyase family enzyme
VLETGLYVADLEQARHFYENVLGLSVMFHDERVAAYNAALGSVLLLFQQGTTETPAELPGGTIPPHDGSGRLHYAFSIAPQYLQAWRDHLADSGIAIEGEVSWPKGGVSLYFRDPDKHLVELATPGLWENY